MTCAWRVVSFRYPSMRDDVLERAESAIETPPVGRREHRVPGDRDERSHASRSVRVDFVGQRGHRQVAAQTRAV